jgi:SAM-dependent methyltransferase
VVHQYSKTGIGLEIGVVERTIAPVSRTILSDAFKSHGADKTSLAKVFFKADKIPYEDDSFGFVFSEHALEHLSNPLKALFHWKEKLTVGGFLILFIPHQKRCCDIYRKRTPMAHIVDDYKKNIQDDDQTHVDDFYENVVLKGLTPHYEHLKKEELARSGNMHHHVWVPEDLVELLNYVGLETVYSEDCVPDRRDSFVIVGQKKS